MTNQNNELDDILLDLVLLTQTDEYQGEREVRIRNAKQQIQALYAPKPVEKVNKTPKTVDLTKTKVNLIDIASPNMTPEASKVVSDAIERSAEVMNKKPVEKGELREQLEEFAIHLKSGTTKGKHRIGTYDTVELTSLVEDLIAQEKAKWVAEAEKLEHYYSHKARKEAGYAELYWCACGKYDRDKDRLLRHVRWHELALAKLLDKENV